MELWKRCYNWLVPQQLLVNVEKRLQIKILVAIFLSNIVICLLTLLFLELAFDLPRTARNISRVLTLMPVLLYIAGLVVLKTTRSTVWAINAAVVGLFLDDLFAIIVTGGIGISPLTGLFILPPLLAFLLGGQRSGVFWSVTVLASQVTLIFCERLGYFSVSSIANDNIMLLLRLYIPVVLNGMFFMALFLFENINASLRNRLIGSNSTLENHSLILDQQNREISLKNRELERSKQVLLQKSLELEASGRYKSEFLSTMSHELRTPLNSILILSRSLMDNRAGHLSAKEIEHASVIHSAGSDLLNLINDILDLSKVEAGKLELVYEKLALADLARELVRQFRFVAGDRGLDFSVHIAEGLPAGIETDIHRLNQILKNLISNALKFTSKGGVYVDIFRPQSPFLSLAPHLNEHNAIVIAVRDTGIGIPKGKQQIIFEAFKQADGTTSRKFGGTGLGLTISRQLATFMNGEISVHSQGEGMGSTFGLILPVQPPLEDEMFLAPDESADEAPTGAVSPEPAQFAMAHPCENILVVEDDKHFAHILLDLIADETLVGDVVHTGEDCLRYLERFIPQAIILDLSLPDMSGWDVLEKIRSSSRLRHLPVHIVSALPEQQRAQAMNVNRFIEKPASHAILQELLLGIKQEMSRRFKTVLIVEDSVVLYKIIADQFAERGIRVIFAETGQQALRLLPEHAFDCFIVDLGLPDYTGTELLKIIRASAGNENKPIIVFTATIPDAEQEFEVGRYADRVIVKAPQALAHLIETTSWFLHQVAISHAAPDPQPEAPAADDAAQSAFVPLREYQPCPMGGLSQRKVLLVDDDMRNVYSLCAVLDGLDMQVVVAASGAEALEKLSAARDFQLILMDIMMPEMDGYETTRRIRRLAGYADIPVIALTAKAMADDRKLCLDAGANDYVTKPVDIEHLKRVMYTWCQERDAR
jgi:CheY-like chemotaxis protein/signal transduction histidine kinase